MHPVLTAAHVYNLNKESRGKGQKYKIARQEPKKIGYEPVFLWLLNMVLGNTYLYAFIAFRAIGRLTYRDAFRICLV